MADPVARSSADRLTDLTLLREAIWRELRHAVQTRDHPWRTPVLATTEAGIADARTVILREVDTAGERVVIYTDSRAAKAVQLRAEPSAMLVLWSPALGWQLRCRLVVQVPDQGLAVTSRWARIGLSRSATDYLSPMAPGAELDSTPSAPPTRQGPIEHHHFGMLDGQVLSVDWLELHPAGHRRARFDRQGARWLQP